MHRLALLASLALSSACITVPSRSEQPPLQNQGGDKATVAFSVDVRSTQGSTWTVSDKVAAEAVTGSLNACGFFADVRESNTRRDISLSVRISLIPSANDDAVSMLFGLGLGLVPVWLTQELDLNVVATMPSAAQRHYTHRGEAVAFAWLPLIVASPFLTNSAAARDLIEDGMTEIVRQMVADECLPVTQASRAAALEAPVPTLEPRFTSSGTGFFVGTSGRIVTSYHVVENASSITVDVEGREFVVDVESFDPSDDLALLALREGAPVGIEGLAVACMGGVSVGAHVFTVGFPLVDIQGRESKYTDGTVSSLSGLGGDTHLLQVSVPVQPGNSGGPLLDDRGRVVGVVQARLGDLETLRTSGALPQGVNYALKSSYLCAFLGRHAEHSTTQDLERTEAIEAARRSVCIVRALIK